MAQNSDGAPGVLCSGTPNRSHGVCTLCSELLVIMYPVDKQFNWFEVTFKLQKTNCHGVFVSMKSLEASYRSY